MLDETASKMYESARDRLKELVLQEAEIKEQISHWGPVVERLARLSGETVDSDIANRINELKQAEAGGAGATGAGQEMGLTEAIRWVFRQPLMLPLTPTQVRDHMAEILDKYKHVMPPIHNTLKRMKEAGEIEEVDGIGGIGRAYRSARRGA